MASEGPRTLDREDRRLIADALRRSAADTRQALSCWEQGGAIEKVVKDKADVEKHRRSFAELAHRLDRLAAEINDQSYEITLATRRPQ